MAELAAIGFSRIDFSEFVTEALHNTYAYTNTPDQDLLVDQMHNCYEPTGSGNLNNSYYSSSQGLPH